ncbi:hypothetical protein [Rubripirellula reticaptiva]|uniref:DUF883 domain-containing protein n=1 Tax=Rubripirellula reticaptiva TaxID=2528013 RepID=A0A5C6F9Y4_9BACT|nr:hypothetical protein [Rubripirellula reticaptiva]TWU58255.1 hypothetical protein Poly59_11660 [Rubripirellula reticaptiva]
MIAPIEQNRVGRYYDRDRTARRQSADEEQGNGVGDQTLQIVRDTIGNHPVAALAIATAVGAAAAWIIKRGVRS